MAVSRVVSGSAQLYMKETEAALKALNKKGLLARGRFTQWADALASGQYVKTSGVLAVGRVTPSPYEFEGTLQRSALGVLCELSQLCSFSEGRSPNYLAQNPVPVEGLDTSAHLSHATDYTYENSRWIPCAGVRAFMIASNRLEEYADSIPLQKMMIHICDRLLAACDGYEFQDIAAMLRRASAPTIL